MVEKEDKKLEAQAHVDELVQKGLVALDEFRLLDQEQVDYIVAKASVAALDQHGVLAKHALDETGRGYSKIRQLRTSSLASTWLTTCVTLKQLALSQKTMWLV